MKLLNSTFLFLSLSLWPHLVFSEDIKLTCPNSGEGSPPFELNLTALGDFELSPKKQSLFIPLQFDHAKMENDEARKRMRLSCVYNSFTDKKAAQKTVTLVAYTSSGATNCTTTSSSKDGKLNQLVCKTNK